MRALLGILFISRLWQGCRRQGCPRYAWQLAVGTFLATATLPSLAGPIEDLQPGHWYRVSGSTLSALNPCPQNTCSYSANLGHRSVVDIWNGGVIASRFGAQGGFVVWGGGHAGYYGNEVYVFDIATLRWQRVSEPVANPSCDQSEGELQNGSPCSRHTYDYIEYHPGSNSLVSLGSTSNHEVGGGGSPRVHLFNFDNRQWRRGARKPSRRGDFVTGASSAYDPSRDVFWLLTAYGQDFAKYDPNANSGDGQWTEYQGASVEIDMVGNIDPVRDLYVAVGGYGTYSVRVYDLKNPTSPGVNVNTAGDLTAQNMQAPAIDWDPSSQAFIAWGGSGTSVYKLAPPAGDWRTGTWQWTRIPAVAGNTVTPTDKNDQGTYSRWRYVPSVNAFVLVNRTTDDVYFYKLNNTPPPPTPVINFTADLSILPLLGTTTIRWSAANADSCTASGSWAGNKPTTGFQLIGPLSLTATFTLSCSNSGGGSATRTISVGLLPPPPSVSISANPSSVTTGSTTSLAWTSSGATSCSAADGDASWTGSKSANGSGTVGPISAQTTYTLTCVNLAGSSSASVTVAVSGPPPVGNPVVTLTADATSVPANGTTTLRWTATNATSCTASGGWSGARSLGGSEAIGPLTASTTYTLGCTNSGGTTVNANVTVSIAAAPTVTLSANPTTVSAGAQSRLTWTSTNATACTASAGDASWTGNKTLNNNQLVGPITAATTYTLTCVGAGGTASASASVFLGAGSQTDVTLTAAPTSIDVGGFTDLTWSTVNATTCTASGGWTGSVGVSGTIRVSGLTSTRVYMLTCTGGSSSDSAQITVTVGNTPPPTAVATEPKKSESGFGAFGSWQTLLLGLVLLLRRMPSMLRALPKLGTLMRVGIISLFAWGVVAMTASAAVDATSVTVVSTSGSSQSNVPATFGQIFKPGDIPSGSTVVASLASSGATVPIQVDAKTMHADGSLRHAVITLNVASLAGNAADQVILSSAASGGGAGSAVTLAQLLASSFDAQISLNIGGTNYAANARTLLQSGTPQVWLNGPLVSEWLVSGPVRTSGGSAHGHLTAYFHVRAYSNGSGGVGSVRVDCIVENGWTLVSGAQSFDYTPTVTVGGATVFTSGQMTHYHHARWHRQFWWPSTPSAYVKPDVSYLMATKAVPGYGSTNISASYLSGLRQSVAPMSNGDLTQYMPSTGAQDQIGPLPRFDAVFLSSNADVRALRNMLANHDAAGSFSVHYRDEATGRPVSIADRPQVSLEVSGSVPSAGGTANPNVADLAHQPSLGFLAYAVTGDYFYLEEMQFWTSWNQLGMHPEYRLNHRGVVHPHNQNRSQAWAMRNLGQSAYLTPDAHPYKAHLAASIQHNVVEYDSSYTNNASANNLGAVVSYNGYQVWAMWQDDFITWTWAYLVDLGFTSATPFRNWKFKFPVGRVGTTDYCFRHVANYIVHSGLSDLLWHPDFKTLHDSNLLLGLFTPVTTCNSGDAIVDGYPAASDGYVANFTPALAAAVEAGYAGASAGWSRLKASPVQPDFSNHAVWNVVPRSNPGSSAPTLTLTANPSTVASGGSTTLTWSSTNASACTATGGWSGSKATSGSQQITNVTQNTSFTLACTGSGGPAAQQTVQVAVNSPPTATLTSSASTVQTGSSVTLLWSSTNATSCAATGGWSGSKNASGSQTITNLTQTVTFTLTCTGAGGTSAPQSVQVTVTAAPPPPPPPVPVATVSLSASPSSIVAGNSATLSWSSTNAVICTASGAPGWSGTKATSGSEAVSPQQTTNYTLTCTNSANANTQQQIQVTVTQPPPPTAPATGTPTESSGGGGAFSLAWIGLLSLAAALRRRPLAGLRAQLNSSVRRAHGQAGRAGIAP